MTSYVPRKSREVHAEGLLRRINDAGPVRFAEGGYVMGAAECVCEEPCRYCQCEQP